MFNELARYYDQIYKNKNYDEEVQFLNEAFIQFKVKSVLDIACGTGEHLKRLDDLAYQVEGMDASGEMVEIAGKKLFCPLSLGHMENFRSPKKYDAIIAMFNSIGYSPNPQQVFQNVFNHLNEGGVFVFDFWNKPAAQKFFEPYREKSLNGIKRISHTKLIGEDTLEIEFTIYKMLEGEIDWREQPISEVHIINIFDPRDMRTNLELAGFGVEMFPFMKPESTITSHDWGIQALCEKI